MLGQAHQHLLQVVSAAHHAPNQPQHARRVLGGHVVGELEEEVLIHHAKGLGELAVLQRRPAERERLIERREGVAEGPVALARQQHQAFLIGLYALHLAHLAQAVHDLRHRNAAKVEPLAPRQDGGQHLVRLRRREDEEGVRGGLFQRLQQGVERLRREHVHLVEDVHLFLLPLRRNAHLLAQLADVIDLVVRRRVHLEDVEAAPLLK